MKSNFIKNNNLNRTTNSSVHACYEPNLVIKLILERFRIKKNKKDVLGTKRFNFQCYNEFPDISIAEIEDFEYLAYYFVSITKRYSYSPSGKLDVSKDKFIIVVPPGGTVSSLELRFNHAGNL